MLCIGVYFEVNVVTLERDAAWEVNARSRAQSRTTVVPTANRELARRGRLKQRTAHPSR